MKIETYHPPEDWLKSYRYYKEYGGVIEYYLYQNKDKLIEDPYLIHRQVAFQTFNQLEQLPKPTPEDILDQEDWEETIEELEDDFKETLEEVEEDMNPFSTSLDLELVEGNSISIGKFMGRLYDLKKDNLILRGKRADFLNAYFYFGSDETSKNIIDIHSLYGDYYSNYSADGYVSAFFDPPYNMQAPKEELVVTFFKINSILWGNLKEDKLVIYEWNTSFHNYFDVGREWWGSYLWTIHSTQKNIYTAIAVSATD